jgi:hypothetical protein
MSITRSLTPRWYLVFHCYQSIMRSLTLRRHSVFLCHKSKIVLWGRTLWVFTFASRARVDGEVSLWYFRPPPPRRSAPLRQDNAMQHSQERFLTHLSVLHVSHMQCCMLMSGLQQKCKRMLFTMALGLPALCKDNIIFLSWYRMHPC